MGDSVREASLDVLRAYDEGEDIKGVIAHLRVLLGGDGGPTYVTVHDRFIVCLEVGYHEVESPEQAVAAALALTRDLGSTDTQWHVFDRTNGEGVIVEQGDVEDLLTDDGCLILERES